MLYNINLPKICNKDLAYFCGLIIGDGSLPIAYSKKPNGNLQRRYIIHFTCNSLDFINNIYIPLFKKLFKITPRLIVVNTKKNSVYYICTIESKMIYQFLKEIGVTNSKKARIAKVPNIPKKYLKDFLAGLLDTDGGKKGSGFGLSTASEHLAEFCENIFKELNFSYHSCPWFHNGHKYHQIYIHKRDLKNILKHIPLKNKDKINLISGHASVA